ncbi:hypothetical protein SB778_31510 [Paraburkholderia sp. SIMBA_050]
MAGVVDRLSVSQSLPLSVGVTAVLSETLLLPATTRTLAVCDENRSDVPDTGQTIALQLSAHYCALLRTPCNVFADKTRRLASTLVAAAVLTAQALVFSV